MGSFVAYAISTLSCINFSISSNFEHNVRFNGILIDLIDASTMISLLQEKKGYNFTNVLIVLVVFVNLFFFFFNIVFVNI